MQLGIITKELVCTVKDENLNSVKLFIVKPMNMDMTEKKDHIVAVENGLGLGIGDIVLYVGGSGSRRIKGNKDMPIDCAISAKVETFNVDPEYLKKYRKMKEEKNRDE